MCRYEWALARWEHAHPKAELFQQFVTSCGKPLKRLSPRSASLHRAKALVLMSTPRNMCEISGLSVRARVRLRTSTPLRGRARRSAPTRSPMSEPSGGAGGLN